MKRFCVIAVALLLILAFVSEGYAAQTAQAAKAKFQQVREVYINAKKELSDAQIEALMTVGKIEKQEVVSRVKSARKALRKAKAEYKSALKALHEAEMTRDAKIDRSPWK